MKRTNRTAGFAAAASFALALAAVACGDSPSITNPTTTARPAPEATFWVSGTISEDTDSGNFPLEGVSVLNWATSEATVTDGAGYFRIGGLHAGLAQLIIAKEGYEERLVEVMIDGDTEVNAVMVRSESN